MYIEDVLKSHGIYAGGGSNIKSIQRGSTTIASNATSTTVTINSVDTSKAFVQISKYCDSSGGMRVRAELTNATTITFVVTTASGTPINVSWEVIEFINVKSLQRGNLSALTISSSQSYNLTINPVNTSKAFIVFSYSSNLNYDNLVVTLSDSATIYFNQGGNKSNLTVNWQLIEFN